MQPPKRPFTTSSLTSQIKSTIASQPLLSNLTNIEKLSSQASSFAQKSPFFNLGQHNDASKPFSPLGNSNSNSSSNNQPTAAELSQNPNVNSRSSANNSSSSMLPHSTSQPAAAAASAPSVDLSHLTQEERMMIQSVMAKAEMADMGMPVDTSAPSSTNLPSHTSQILTQQRQQQQQQHEQQQRQQQQQMSGANQYQPQQQQQQQQQQAQSQQLQQMMMMNGNNPQQQFYPSFGNQQQPQQHQQQPQHQPQGNDKGMLNQQQTQQLVSQINSQFNLHQPEGANRSQQQPQQYPASGQQQMTSLQHQDTSQLTHQNRPQQQPMNSAFSQQQMNNSADSFVGAGQQFAGQSAGQHQQQHGLMMANSFDRQQQQFGNSSNTGLAGVSGATLDPMQPVFSAASSMQRQPPPQQQQPAPQPRPMTAAVSSYNPTNLTSLQQQQSAAAAAAQQTSLANDNSFDSNSMIANLQFQHQQPQAILSSTSQQMQPQYSQLVSQAPSAQAQQQQQQHRLEILQQQQQDPTSQSMLALYQQPQPATAARPEALIVAAGQHQQLATVLAPQAGQQQQYVVTTTLGAGQPAAFIEPEQATLSDQEYASRSARGGRRTVARQQSSGRPASARKQESASGRSSAGPRGRRQTSESEQSYDVAQPRGRHEGPPTRRQESNKSPGWQPSRKLPPQPGQQQQLALVQPTVASIIEQSAVCARPPTGRQRERPAARRVGARVRQYEDQQAEEDDDNDELEDERDQLDQDFDELDSELAKEEAPAEDEEEEGDDDDHGSYVEPREQRAPKKGSSVRSQQQQQRKSPSATAMAKKAAAAAGAGKKSASPVGNKIATGAAESEQAEADEADKTKEEALKLLSELKLSEQASQVMEQQQLLIKQSQELIKLQLEQQQLSQELKKSMKSAASELAQAEGDDLPMASGQDETSETNSKDSQPSSAGANKQATTSADSDLERVLRRANKTRLQRQDLYGRKPTVGQPRREAADSELDADADGDDYKRRRATRAGRLYGQQSGSSLDQQQQRRRPTSTSDQLDRPARSSHLLASNRYSRELHSPTDTTDSDTVVEHSAARQRCSRASQRPSSAGLRAAAAAANQQPRRREPAGLPPSPLPVAAAIQMHQMQLLNQYRTQQLRSRSVTSSPNHHHPAHHHQDPLAAGYLTDSQQLASSRAAARSVSPETLSEFGGQRHRKRLPEPPSNAIPITPSMVRKMIQAQRAASAGLVNDPTRSANATAFASSPLAAIHQHQPAATSTTTTTPMARPNLAGSGGFSSAASASRWGSDSHQNTRPGFGLGTEFQPQQKYRPANVSSSLSDQQHVSFLSSPAAAATATTSEHPLPASGAIRFGSTATAPASIGGELASTSSLTTNHKTSPFGTTASSSIIRAGTTISEVKETPELDKMISDLNEYYGLDGGSGASAKSKYQASRASAYAGAASLAGQCGSASGRFSSQHHPSLARCNSEGEDGSLATRLNQRLSSARPIGGLSGSYDDHSLSVATTPLYGSSLGASYLLDRTKYQPRHTGPSLGELRGSGSSTLDYLTRPSFRPSAGLNANQAASELGELPLGSADPPVDRPWAQKPGLSSAAYTPKRYYEAASSSPLDVDSILRDRYGSAAATSSSITTPTTTTTTAARSAPGQFASQLQDYHRQPSSSADRSPWSSSYLSSVNPATSLRPPLNSSLSIGLDRSNPPSSEFSPLMTAAVATTTTPTPSRYRQTDGLSDPIDQARQRRSYLTNNQHKSLDLNPSRAGHSHGLYDGHHRGGSPSRYHHQPGSGLTEYKPSTLTRLGGEVYMASGQIGSGSYANRAENRLLSEINYGSYTDSGAPTTSGARGNFLNFTKDDIIRNGPKFDSIGYRFRTENQNKYVAQSKSPPIQSFQSRYPHPYKRILLSKNPKDRIGNGIGVRIVGGQPIPRCIVTSGAFVAEVFQNSNVYFMDEIHEGDQIVEWNGVNLCNRSNEEVQQILFSQFSDDEVEIVYLSRDKFNQAYGGWSSSSDSQQQHSGRSQLLSGSSASKPFGIDDHDYSGKQRRQANLQLTGDTTARDTFESFSNINKAGDSLLTAGMMQENPLFGTRTYEHVGKSIRRKLSLSSISNMWK